MEGKFKIIPFSKWVSWSVWHEQYAKIHLPLNMHWTRHPWSIQLVGLKFMWSLLSQQKLKSKHLDFWFWFIFAPKAAGVDLNDLFLFFSLFHLICHQDWASSRTDPQCYFWQILLLFEISHIISLFVCTH